MANEGLYFKNSEDIATYFPAYDLSETKKIKGFKNSSDEDVLESTVHYSDNGWERNGPIPDLFKGTDPSDVPYDTTFVYAGNYPSFARASGSIMWFIDGGPGEYYLCIENGDLILRKDSITGTAIATRHPASFKDKILPDRMILMLQGAGGGGGGQYVGWPGNRNGSGGGSGAFIACMIDTGILKTPSQHLTAALKITVGAGGSAGGDNVAGSDGGDSKVEYALISNQGASYALWCKAGGGEAGKIGDTSASYVSGGSGGAVTVPGNILNTHVWNIPGYIHSETIGGYVYYSQISGADGAWSSDSSHKGGDIPRRDIYPTFNRTYQVANKYSSGSDRIGGEYGGGGASLWADGADGHKGISAEKGSGGCGKTAGYPGWWDASAGGDGLFQLWY